MKARAPAERDTLRSMRGYTKEQLDAKGATLANYVFCENCSLYWHKRSYKEHLRPGTKASATREIAILHPAWESLMDFLVETAIEKLMEERKEALERGDGPNERVDQSAPSVPASPMSPTEPELISVDEAVTRLGVSREEILAEFEKHMVPFEVTIPSTSSRRRRPTSG